MQRLLAATAFLCLTTACYASASTEPYPVYETIETNRHYDQVVLGPALRGPPRTGPLAADKRPSFDYAGGSALKQRHGASESGSANALSGGAASVAAGLGGGMELGGYGQVDLDSRIGGRHVPRSLHQPVLGFGSTFRWGTTLSERSRAGLSLWSGLHFGTRKVAWVDTITTTTEWSDGSVDTRVQHDDGDTTRGVVWPQGGLAGWGELDLRPRWTLGGGVALQAFPSTWGDESRTSRCADDLLDEEDMACSGTLSTPEPWSGPALALTPHGQLSYRWRDLALRAEAWGHLGPRYVWRTAPAGAMLGLSFQL